MKPEAQRIAIAEANGYVGPFESHNEWEDDGDTDGFRDVLRDANGRRLPDYPHNLNAMHEAEKMLTEGQRLWFGESLHKLLKLEYELDDDTQLSGWSVFYTAHATAAQRAEAFLRTIGKWEDDK